jgi:glycosyltransferase involved in cell wall biosynthesis
MTLVTVSDWLKSQVEQSFLGKYPIVRIYNGVDRSIFAPVASSIRKKYNLEEKYIILGVSDGWSERKGLSFFKSLSKQLEEDEVIIMIGFKSQKEIKKLPSNIIAFCRTENVNQLVEFYSTADVVLNPSFEETFGMVTAEALCCGTPVIVQNKTACPELVDETCGCVLKDSLGLEIRRAVTELKQNRIETSACLKRTELFDKQNNYRYYVELYKTIMGRQN